MKPDDLKKRDMLGREKVLHVKNVDFNCRSAGFSRAKLTRFESRIVALDFSYVSRFWLSEPRTVKVTRESKND